MLSLTAPPPPPPHTCMHMHTHTHTHTPHSAVYNIAIVHWIRCGFSHRQTYVMQRQSCADRRQSWVRGRGSAGRDRGRWRVLSREPGRLRRELVSWNLEPGLLRERLRYCAVFLSQLVCTQLLVYFTVCLQIWSISLSATRSGLFHCLLPDLVSYSCLPNVVYFHCTCIYMYLCATGSTEAAEGGSGSGG